MLLGAGKAKRKKDSIDPTAGLLSLKKTGDFVRRGEPIARMYASDETLFDAAENTLSAGAVLFSAACRSAAVADWLCFSKRYGFY